MAGKFKQGMIILNLHQIQDAYDVIISLGSWCGPSLNLRRHNLRRFSFPFDWVLSYSLPDVIRLLRNRFNGYMEINNMRRNDGHSNFADDGVTVGPHGGTEQVKAHLIEDTFYNISSVHDFKIVPNQDWTVQYPYYKEKLTYRINKFINVLASSQSVLFVRWGEVTVNEALELQSVLNGMVNGKFNILFIQPVNGLEVVNEVDWGINGICTVQFPLNSIDAHWTWDYVLNGITLTNFWI